MESAKQLINEECWNRQHNFNSAVVNVDSLSLERQQQLTKEFVLLLEAEAVELLNNVNWKQHRSSSKQIVVSNIHEELIDIFKFWCGLCQVWSVTTEQLYEEFNRKSDVVELRYQQEIIRNLKEEKNVVAFDLDGVLADYHNYFLNYINQYVLGKEYASLEDAKLKLGVLKYEEIKDAYRQSGAKISIPLIDGAKLALEQLSKQYKIVVLSSRPYSRYNRIFADTIEWLRRNELSQYVSAILFDEKKDRKILEEIPHLHFFVEDDLKMANEVSDAGIKVFLLNHDYNVGDVHENVKRISNLRRLAFE